MAINKVREERHAEVVLDRFRSLTKTLSSSLTFPFAPGRLFRPKRALDWVSAKRLRGNWAYVRRDALVSLFGSEQRAAAFVDYLNSNGSLATRRGKSIEVELGGILQKRRFLKVDVSKLDPR
jgi:hypothetical protein